MPLLTLWGIYEDMYIFKLILVLLKYILLASICCRAFTWCHILGVLDMTCISILYNM
jgi:hypothetical protein